MKTIETTIEETTVDLYTLEELDKDAREKALQDYIEERAADPYYWQHFADCTEREIWECVRGLEKSISAVDVRWSYNPWYSADFDCVYKLKGVDWIGPDEMEPAEDDGYCYSMDLCDAWNAHIRRLNGLARMYLYMVDLQGYEYPAHEWECGGDPCNRAFYYRLEGLINGLRDRWFAELEAACEDVTRTLEGLLQSEWEYYDSREYAELEFEDEYTQGGKWYTCEYPYYKNGGYTGRVYYSDNRRWYTADGTRYDDAPTVCDECISIVKAS